MPDYVKLKTSYISQWQICFTYYDEQKHHFVTSGLCDATQIKNVT